MSSHGDTRRQCLRLVCALGIAALAPMKRSAAAEPPGVGSISAEPTAAALLADGIDLDALSALAAEYPNSGASDASLRRIMQLLQSTGAPSTRSLARLRAMIQADFNEARLIRLSGWHLSRTEAQVIVAAHRILSESRYPVAVGRR